MPMFNEYAQHIRSVLHDAKIVIDCDLDDG